MAANINVNNWIKNASPTSTSQGKCAAWSGNIDFQPINSSINTQPDYAYCDKNNCKQISHNKWNMIWGGCKEQNDIPLNKLHASDRPDSELGATIGTKDKCYNMITTSEMEGNGTGRFAAINFECNHSAGIFNPNNCTCNPDDIDGDADVDCIIDRVSKECAIWCVNYNNNKGYHAAYPMDVTAPTIPNNQAQTNDNGIPVDCPNTYSRTFICNRDGENEDNQSSNNPGCGKRITTVPNGGEDGIGFCARNKSDYRVENLMGCCLGDTGSATNSGHKNCPVGYCRSPVTQTSTIEDGNTCLEPVGASSGDRHCYEMTEECNDIFRDICKSELFDYGLGGKTYSVIKENYHPRISEVPVYNGTTYQDMVGSPAVCKNDLSLEQCFDYCNESNCEWFWRTNNGRCCPKININKSFLKKLHIK